MGVSAIVGRRIVRLGSAGEPVSSKYRNKPTFVDGIRWASKKQALRYRELRMLEAAGQVRNLRWEVTYPLKVCDMLVCKYRADFVYEELKAPTPVETDAGLICGAPTWFEIVEDVKGQKDGAAYRVFKIKAALMLALFGITVREI